MMLRNPSRLLTPFKRCWFCWPSVMRRSSALRYMANTLSKAMKHLNLLSLGLLLCGGCSTSQPTQASQTEKAGLAGSYRVDHPDDKIDLYLGRDGTYIISVHGWAGSGPSESGAWTAQAGNIVLHPAEGAVSAKLRRLRVVAGNTGHPQLVVPDDHEANALAGLTFEPKVP